VNDWPCIGPERADLRRQVARLVREDVEPDAPAWDEAGCLTALDPFLHRILN